MILLFRFPSDFMDVVLLLSALQCLAFLPFFFSFFSWFYLIYLFALDKWESSQANAFLFSSEGCQGFKPST